MIELALDLIGNLSGYCWKYSVREGSEFAEVVFLLALFSFGILKPLFVFTLTRFSALLLIFIHSFRAYLMILFTVPLTMISKDELIGH